MRQFVKNTPVLGRLATYVYNICHKPKLETKSETKPESISKTEPIKFRGSQSYWESRYNAGGNSGVGSYGRLAIFKSQIVNTFVKENNIKSIIEFGCGDSNQLSLAFYPKYIGLDVSSTAIKLCKERFRDDKTKSFFLYDSLCFVDNHSIFSSDLGLSMDVIYHLVEDDVFHEYMLALFGCSKEYVIVYSSNYESQQVFHIKDRQFTSWILKFAPAWQLINVLKNVYPNDPNDPTETSRSDFYIFKRSGT